MKEKVAVKRVGAVKKVAKSRIKFQTDEQDRHQKIQETAYFLFVKRGCVEGFAEVDWIEAEKIVTASEGK